MFFEFILPFFLILLTGTAVLRVINLPSDKPLLLQLAFAYGAGIACITLQMMFYSFFSIPWSVFLLLTPWAIILIYSLVVKKTQLNHKFKFQNKFKGLDLILLLGIIATVFFVIFEVNIRPLTGFDAWANWFIGGKAFFMSGALDPVYLQYVNNSNGPIISLLIAFVSLVIGHFQEKTAMLFFTSFYVALLIVFYHSARDFMSKRYALIFTFLLATIENLIRHSGRYDAGYADMPLGYFIFGASVMVLELMRTKSWKNLFLFNLFITVAALIKSEGIPIFITLQLIVLATFFIYKGKLLKYLILLGISVLTISTWHLFIHIHNLPENPFIQSAINLGRVPIVAAEMLKEFLNLIRWNLIWIAFLLSLIFIRKNKYSLVLGIICLTQLFAYFFVYLTTPLNPTSHVQNSFDRLLLHITPVAMLMISIVFAGKNLNERKQKK